MAKVIGVKFKNSAKVYYFAPNNEDMQKGDGGVVETARGVEYATCACPVRSLPDTGRMRMFRSVSEAGCALQ